MKQKRAKLRQKSLKSQLVTQVRVYYEDTDAGGIVYHASYLKFAERARTECVRGIGLNHQKLLADYNLLFAVKHLSIDYLAPAHLDDLLEIHTEICGHGAATLDMRQIIRHEEKVLAALSVKLVAITPDGKVLRLPVKLRQIMQPWLPKATVSHSAVT